MVKDNVFPLSLETRQGFPPLALLFIIVNKILDNAVSQEKDTQMGPHKIKGLLINFFPLQ